MTRHGDIVTRILNSYPMGPGLVVALEAYIKTCEQTAHGRALDGYADTVCERLHDGPSSGLVCKSCATATETTREYVNVLNDIERANKT